MVSDDSRFENSNTAEIGDIALWDGHVGIVTSVCKDGKIKLIHARGAGKEARENPYEILPSQCRGSTFFGYYRPLKETPDGKLDNGDKPVTATPQAAKPIDDNKIYNGGTLNEVPVTPRRTEENQRQNE